MVVALAAEHIADVYGGPVMLLALLIGIALSFLSEGERCGPGIKFSSKKLLRIGIALLGLRIALEDIIGLGWGTALIVLVAVAATIGFGIVAARAIRSSLAFGVLVGGATAICGASAALAIGSVLPKRRISETDITFTVIAVTTFSTVAMVLYPALAVLLGFNDRLTGILIGATIHDVAQVVGAGYAVSVEAGDTATIVKLFRVAMLLPLVLLVSLLFAADRKQEGGAALPIPGFAIAFAILVGVNSWGILPEQLTAILVELSRFLLVTAVAAIGLTTNLGKIAELGPRPIGVALGATLGLLALAAALLALMPPV